MKILKSIFILFSVLALAALSTNAYFSSQARVSGNVFSTGFWPTTPKVVINEVHYDVKSPEKGDEGKNEWIELYNPTPNPINLKDWKITDNSGTERIIHSNTIIQPSGFVIISKDASTWALYWTMPPESPKIELGLLIGNGLSNDGDRVILKDSSGNIIDQMSYGTDTSILNPSCPDVTEGHSLERSPVGKDTDTKDDFIDQVSPTPGLGIE